MNHEEHEGDEKKISLKSFVNFASFVVKNSPA